MRRKKNHQLQKLKLLLHQIFRVLVKRPASLGSRKRKRGRILKLPPGSSVARCKTSGCQLGAPNPSVRASLKFQMV